MANEEHPVNGRGLVAAQVVALLGAVITLIGFAVVPYPRGGRMLELLTDYGFESIFSDGVDGLQLALLWVVLPATMLVIGGIAVRWVSGSSARPPVWIMLSAALIPAAIIAAAVILPIRYTEWEWAQYNLKFLVGPLNPGGEANPESIVLLGGLVAAGALFWERLTAPATSSSGASRPDMRSRVAHAPSASEEPSPSVADQLRELARLKDDEIITQEEFDEKRAQLAARL